MTEKAEESAAAREHRPSGPGSLSAKLLLAALVSRYYMSADAVAARKAAIYTELNRFVTDGGIAGNDADALQRFNSEREYVSVTVYSSEELELPAGRQMPIQSTSLQSAEIRLDSGRGSAPPAAEAASDESPETEMVQSQGGGYLGGGMRSYALLRRSESSGKLYPMRFSDGMYYVAITDNSRTREDTMDRIMALVAAVVVLVSVLFWYTNRLTWRVIRLSQERLRSTAGTRSQGSLRILTGCGTR